MKQEDALWLRISGLCGLIAPIVALTCVVLAIAYYPLFSWTDNALSDLGVQEGISPVLFNYGLVVSGTLAVTFGSGLYILLSHRASGKIGASLFVLDALALVAIGFFNESFRPMHGIASIAFFTLLPLSMVPLMLTFLVTNNKKLGIATFVTAFFSAAVWVIQWVAQFSRNVAIPEFTSALLASAWTMLIGTKMLMEATRSGKQ